MPIEVKVTGETGEDVVEALQSLVDAADKYTKPSGADDDNPKTETKPAPKKGGRKKKAAEPEPEPEEEETEDSEEEETPPAKPAPKKAATAKKGKGPTLEDCRGKIREINDAFGMEKAREIIVKFGASRVQEIDESKYQDFIDECDNELVAA